MQNQPIRFAVDSNIIGLLGFATLLPKDKFLYYNNNDEVLYRKLHFIHHLMQTDRLELIVPHTVFHELIKQRPLTQDIVQNLPAAKIAQLRRSEFFKNYAMKYLREKSNKNIKIAYFANGMIGDYIKEIQKIGAYYSEAPCMPENMSLSYRLQQKPFFLYDGKLSNDAMIMAEATMLGLDIITNDHHFIAEDRLNIPKIIEEINLETFQSNVVPVSFDNFFKHIARKRLETFNLNKKYEQKINPKFVEVEFLTHKDFTYRAVSMMRSKKEYWKDKMNIAELRTLFLKYLEMPINLDSLRPEDTDYNAALIAAGLKKAPKQPIIEEKEEIKEEPAQVKLSKPKLLKSKNATTRIKFDMMGPDAMANIDKFFGTSQENDNLTNEQ